MAPPDSPVFASNGCSRRPEGECRPPACEPGLSGTRTLTSHRSECGSKGTRTSLMERHSRCLSVTGVTQFEGKMR